MKRQVNEKLPESDKFEARDNKKYEIKVIINILVYGHEAENQLPDLYYIVLWKSYLEEKSTWEPSMPLRKLINIFNKKHFEKLSTTSLFLDSTPLIPRLIVPKEQLKQKRGRLSKKGNKNGKN